MNPSRRMALAQRALVRLSRHIEPLFPDAPAPLPVSALAVCAWRPNRSTPAAVLVWPVPVLASGNIGVRSARPGSGTSSGIAGACAPGLPLSTVSTPRHNNRGNESAKCTAPEWHLLTIYLAFPSIGDVPESAVRGGALGLRCSPRQPTRNDRARQSRLRQPGQARSDWPVSGRLQCRLCRLARNEKLSRFCARPALPSGVEAACPGQWHQRRCRPPLAITTPITPHVATSANCGISPAIPGLLPMTSTPKRHRTPSRSMTAMTAAIPDCVLVSGFAGSTSATTTARPRRRPGQAPTSQASAPINRVNADHVM